jgi:hypothetical protein
MITENIENNKLSEYYQKEYSNLENSNTPNN